LSLLTALFLVMACGPQTNDNDRNKDTTPVITDPGPGTDVSTRDWSDVPDVLERKCATCHTPEGVAPFPLVTWEDAQPWGPAMENEILAGVMPPWPAGDADVSYRDHRGLTDEEFNTLLDWIEAGTPAWGDPPRDLDPPPQGQLPRIDLSLTMPEPYGPQLSPDDIRCFFLDLPEPIEGYVVASEIVPGNLSVAHHANIVKATGSRLADYTMRDEADPMPGFDCNDSQAGISGKLGTWLPGYGAMVLPDEVGLQVEPEARLVLIMHYWEPGWDGIDDQTTVNLTIEPEVDYPADWLRLKDGGHTGTCMEADDTDASFTSNVPVDMIVPGLDLTGQGGLFVHSVLLHMHTFGTTGRVELVKRGVDYTTLLNIAQWDFDWQLEYTLNEPVIMEFGDWLQITCNYEKEPGFEVLWGDDTEDEMCNAILLVSET